MRKNVLTCVVLLAGVTFCTSAMASDTGKILAMRAEVGTPIVLGQWHAGFTEVKNYAVNNGLPLLAIWSNGEGCSHCQKLERCMAQGVFTTWMKESGVVFYFGCNEDKSSDDRYGGTAYNWCWKNQSLTLFPFVRFYWKAKKGTVLADGTVLTADKVLVDTAIVGDKFDNYKDKAEGAKYAVSYAKKIFKQYDPNPSPASVGGEFGCPDSSVCGLQAEIGFTTDVVVPLVRTKPLAVAQAFTNLLAVTYPSGLAVTNEIQWSTGDDGKMLVVNINEDAFGSAGPLPQEEILMTLCDETGVAYATNRITIVEPVGNSPLNPFWIGERTADSLGFGEWTMDLDVLTNKVAMFNATQSAQGPANECRAYSLVLVAGGLWSPDCIMTERNVLEDERFKEWALNRNVALGVLDIPNYNSNGRSATSLLSYDVYPVSQSYVTGGGTWDEDETLYLQSGASYLSRHMVSPEDAASIEGRNRRLVGNDVLNGGFRRPESANKYRTAVPTFLILREDGSVAGRITGFANYGVDGWRDAYLSRFDELLDMADSEGEDDDCPLTTKAICKMSSVATNSLSAIDATDCYRVPLNTGRLVATVDAFDADAPCQGVLQIVAVSNGVETVLSHAAFAHGNEATVVAFVNEAKEVYIRVTADATLSGAPQSFLREGNSVSPYALSAIIDDKYHVATLVYGADQGNLPDKIWVAEGLPIGPLPEPVRGNYRFVGWFTEEAGGQMMEEGAMLDDDIVLFAHWQRLSSLSFDMNRLSEVHENDIEEWAFYMPPITVDSGSLAEVPECDLHYFLGGRVAGWATSRFGEIEYRAGDFVEMDSDLTLYAVWEGSSGCRSFDSGGVAVWTYEDQVGWRSGSIGNSSVSWLEMTVEGRAEVLFSWMASTEQYDGEVFDYAYLSIDGEPQGRVFFDESSDRYVMEGVAIGGESNWENVVFELTEPGIHTIRWVYVKDEVDESEIGEDCVWVKNIAVNPLYLATFDLNGAEGETPPAVLARGGEVFTLPDGGAFSKACHSFQGWEWGAVDEMETVWVAVGRDAEFEMPWHDVTLVAMWEANVLDAPVIYSADVEDGWTVDLEAVTLEIWDNTGASIYYTLDGSDPAVDGILYEGPFVAEGLNVTIRAISVMEDFFDSEESVFSFSRLPYSPGECLNAEKLSIATGNSDAAWVRVLGDNAHDCVAAMRSCEIGDGESSTIEMTVLGAGEIGFWWKTSSEISRNRKYDYVSFLIDGEEASWLGGEKDWTNETFVVLGTGMHTLKWVYQKNENGMTAGEDCAWLDEVVWVPYIDLIPAVAVDAAPEVVTNAVAAAGFADAAVKEVIGWSAAEYNAFKTWADGVKGVTGDALAGEAAVVANAHAAAAYLLGAERLFENEPTVEIGELAIVDGESAGTTAMTVAVTVKDGESAVAVSVANVAAMFEATSDLGDWDGAAKLTPTVTVSGTDSNGKMTFNILPGVGLGTRAFLRIKR